MRISGCRREFDVSPESSARNRRHPFAALVAIIATLLASGYVFLAGLFSDWSGRHTVPPPFIVGALALLLVGSRVSWLLFHGPGSGKEGPAQVQGNHRPRKHGPDVPKDAESSG